MWLERGSVATAADHLGRGSGVAHVLIPSLLAAQAGGRNRFEIDAPTLGDALRALPVADLLFDERGELRPLVNPFVDRVLERDLIDAAPR
jgi:hypothetical protein